jgi:hypothetical protein
VQGSRLDDISPSVLQGRTACTVIRQSTEALWSTWYMALSARAYQ